ncbi:DUF2461 domain-containing protein [bacterium]|nr:DUF2461 domain-containing protein [bacterium]
MAKAAAKAVEIAPFTGFTKKTIAFYRDLAKHNEREWFEAHRDSYMNDVIAPAQSFIVSMGGKVAKLSGGLQANPDYNGKGSFKKIFTDVRYNQDRNPYKTWMDIMFWEGTRKSKKDNSAFYLRMNPEKLFLVAGIKGFDNSLLKGWRSEMANTAKQKAAKTVVDKLRKGGYEILGETYKTLPRGANEDGPMPELQKYSGFYAVHEEKLPDVVYSEKLLEHCLKHYKAMLPLHQLMVGIAEKHK